MDDRKMSLLSEKHSEVKENVVFMAKTFNVSAKNENAATHAFSN